MLRRIVRRLRGRTEVRRSEHPDDEARKDWGAARLYFLFARVSDALALYQASLSVSRDQRTDLLKEFAEQIDPLIRKFLKSAQYPACAGCGKYGHGYMLDDEVWKAAAREGERFLCLECIERRLERPLHPADFPPDLPINEPLFAAFKIGGRRDGTIITEFCDDSGPGVPPL